MSQPSVGKDGVVNLMKVVVSRRTMPLFPERCVVCSLPGPKGSAMVCARDHRKGRAWWSGWFFVRVPCCHWCWLRLRVSRLVRAWAPVVIVVLAWSAYFALSRQMLSWGAALLAIVLGAVGLALLGLLFELFPPPFSVDPRDASVVYKFRDSGLGREFEVLNRAHAPTSGSSSPALGSRNPSPT